MSSLSPASFTLTDAAIAAVISGATVGNAIGTLGVGAVGDYGFFGCASATYTAGATLAASSLTYAGLPIGAANTGVLSGKPAGTWMCLGYTNSSNAALVTVWRRIA